jgi:hypothetical protein
MKSLLYQENVVSHQIPPGCGLCDRNEVPISIRKDGRIYRFVLRDKISIDDVYAVGVKAVAFAIQQGEPFAGTPTARNVKDFLIKLDVVI